MATAAARCGAQLVAISRGGALERLAHDDRRPAPPRAPTGYLPRAAIGALVAPLRGHAVPQRARARARTRSSSRAQEQLARRRDACQPKVEGAANPARELARQIGRTIPLIYGGGALGAVAAYRWKCDVNENAKAPAFWHAYPELDHNEICAWGQHGDVTRQLITLDRAAARLRARAARHALRHHPRDHRGGRAPGALGRGRRRGPARAAARPHVPRRLGVAATSRSRTTSTPARSTRSSR